MGIGERVSRSSNGNTMLVEISASGEIPGDDEDDTGKLKEVQVDKDCNMVKKFFEEAEELRYLWHEDMMGMCGNTYPVLGEHMKNGYDLIALPSPNGDNDGKWYFPLQTVARLNDKGVKLSECPPGKDEVEFKVGDKVKVLDYDYVKQFFEGAEQLKYRWDDSMKVMCGEEFEVLSEHKHNCYHMLGLKAPDKAKRKMWYFPVRTVEKLDDSTVISTDDSDDGKVAKEKLDEKVEERRAMDMTAKKKLKNKHMATDCYRYCESKFEQMIMDLHYRHEALDLLPGKATTTKNVAPIAIEAGMLFCSVKNCFKRHCAEPDSQGVPDQKFARRCTAVHGRLDQCLTNYFSQLPSGAETKIQIDECHTVCPAVVGEAAAEVGGEGVNYLVLFFLIGTGVGVALVMFGIYRNTQWRAENEDNAQAFLPNQGESTTYPTQEYAGYSNTYPTQEYAGYSNTYPTQEYAGYSNTYPTQVIAGLDGPAIMPTMGENTGAASFDTYAYREAQDHQDAYLGTAGDGLHTTDATEHIPDHQGGGGLSQL